MRSIWPTRLNIFGRGKRQKVFVGLSGGVDSAVSAALLQKQGYDVTGVFIRIVVPGYPCTAGEDKRDALRVAAHLHIPFLELNLSKEHEKEVFENTIEEFKKGHTPNPDTLCNKQIKFGKFYDFARERGADFIATGHYARVALHRSKASETQKSSAEDFLSPASSGLRMFPQPSSVSLLAGVDQNKDQSYFLWMVPGEVLEHVLLPLGTMQKSQVRALAKKLGLPNAERKDSQGLCFLGPVSLDEMLVQELQPKPGVVLDERGRPAGAHQGAVRYTLGQRHGFDLTAQSPHTPAHFVIAKDVAANTITVSPNAFPQGVTKTIITLRDSNWIGERFSGECRAQYRYHQTHIPANMIHRAHETIVELHEPHYAPLGQSLVLYDGERCLGGGVIAMVEYA